MSRLAYNPADEKQWVQQRELQLSVLRYLRERGPTNWCALHFHFDKNNMGEIEPALGHLLRCQYIVVEGITTTITALGMEQLKNGA